MIAKRIAAPLMATGLILMLAGCGGEEQEAADSEAVEKQPQGEVAQPQAADRVKKESREAMDALADYSAVQRDEAQRRAKVMLADLEIEIRRLRTDIEQGASELSEEARQQLEQTMDRLEVQRERVEQATEDLGDDTSRAWGDVKAGFAEGYASLKSAFQEARREYSEESGQDDDPDNEEG